MRPAQSRAGLWRWRRDQLPMRFMVDNTASTSRRWPRLHLPRLPGLTLNSFSLTQGVEYLITLTIAKEMKSLCTMKLHDYTLTCPPLGLVASFRGIFCAPTFHPKAGNFHFGNAELSGSVVSAHAPDRKLATRLIGTMWPRLLVSRVSRPCSRTSARPAQLSVSFSGKSHELSGSSSERRVSECCPFTGCARSGEGSRDCVRSAQLMASRSHSVPARWPGHNQTHPD